MVEPDEDWQLVSSGSLLAKQAEVVRLKAAKRIARLEKADSTVKANVIQAITISLIPMPLLDVVALTNIQFKMLDDLVKLYGIRYTKIGKSVVNAFILGVLPVATVTGLSSMLKLMPGIGSFVGSAGVAVSGGGLTYATGKVFVRHFETGGTLDNFNLQEAKRQFRQEFRKGKQVARDLAVTKHLPLSKPE
ncbi:YcjF family protein [Thiothrix lacustris]|uniref:YcjF family protein n=1 Tax=Thiothrix lacustris TaxID=525917 RepID=UPI0027E47EE6|nr:DUF697 domain-containing protein [Thiothrix lacustris]WMP19403.1 DUF697 domain-containing protein [Thiothrix lacustris]